jgi:hypothetical protein
MMEGSELLYAHVRAEHVAPAERFSHQPGRRGQPGTAAGDDRDLSR